MPSAQQNETVELDERIRNVASHNEKAKAKSARLRHMKERNENYLAEQERRRRPRTSSPKSFESLLQINALRW